MSNPETAPPGAEYPCSICGAAPYQYCWDLCDWVTWGYGYPAPNNSKEV